MCISTGFTYIQLVTGLSSAKKRQNIIWLLISVEYEKIYMEIHYSGSHCFNYEKSYYE